MTRTTTNWSVFQFITSTLSVCMMKITFSRVLMLPPASSGKLRRLRQPISRNFAQLRNFACATFYGAACATNLWRCLAVQYLLWLTPQTKVAQLAQGFIKSAAGPRWSRPSADGPLIYISTGRFWRGHIRPVRPPPFWNVKNKQKQN